MPDLTTLPFLRVATLNLLASPYALRERIEHLAALLAEEKVDVLLLQEVLRRKGAKFNVPVVLGAPLGLNHVVEHHISGRSSGNVTLSRFPMTKLDVTPPDSRMLVARATVDGRDLVIINNHGAWGSYTGGARLDEAKLADQIARGVFNEKSPNVEKGYRPSRGQRPVVIYGGDLNTTPDSAPIRYLTGRDVIDGESTVWMDVWEAAPADADGATIMPTPFSSIEYGQRVDTPYLPERHPRQRYDYLFVHEWSYGHAGDPLRARRFAGTKFVHERRELTVSDHLGVMADLYFPPGDA